MSDCQQNSPCCNDRVRQVTPDTLDVFLSFTGITRPGVAASATATMQRRCPPVFLRSVVVTTETEDGETITEQEILADYISNEIDLGAGFKVRAAMSGSLLWIIKSGIGTNSPETPFVGKAFNIYEGYAVMKLSGSSPTCSPTIEVNDDWFGTPISLPLATSWSAIAAATVSAGWYQACETEFQESLPNGWDIATLIPVPINPNFSRDLLLSFKKSNPGCCPADHGVVQVINPATRLYGGHVMFADQTTVPQVVVGEFPSMYGARYRLVDAYYAFFGVGCTLGMGTWYQPSTPLAGAGLYSNAPYAAVATHKMRSIGENDLEPDIRLFSVYAKILCPSTPLVFPRGITEMSTKAQMKCSDCSATMKPSQPYYQEGDVDPILIADFPERSEMPIDDCPKKFASAAAAQDVADILEAKRSMYPYGSRRGVDVYDFASATYGSSEKAEMTISVGERVLGLRLRNVTGATSGTFKLALAKPGNQPTSDIDVTATASQIQAAVEALSYVDPGEFLCDGGPLGTADVVVTFSGKLTLPANANPSWHVTSQGSPGVVVGVERERLAEFATFATSEPIDTNYPTSFIGGSTTLVAEYVDSFQISMGGRMSTGAAPNPAEWPLIEERVSDEHGIERVFKYFDQEKKEFYDTTRTYYQGDPRSPLKPISFKDGAVVTIKSCNTTFRNCPNESLFSVVNGVTFGSGLKDDLFWPNHSIRGATAPIDTTGASTAASSSFRIRYFAHACRVGSTREQPGGGGGLAYIGVPMGEADGGHYISASGDAYCKSRLMIHFLGNGGIFGLGGGYDWIDDDPGFSTDSDLAIWGGILGQCLTNPLGSNGQIVTGVSQDGPFWFELPSGLQWNLFSLWQTPQAYYAARASGVGGALGKNVCLATTPTLGACSPLYAQFGPHNSRYRCSPSQQGSTAPFIFWPGESGVKPGPFTDLEFEGYSLLSGGLYIDPCNSRVEVRLRYRIYWIKRVELSASYSWTNMYKGPNISDIGGPWNAHTGGSYTRRSWIQYGFWENHEVVFSANIQTDFCLRPNPSKNRVITLAFESDAIIGPGADTYIDGTPCQLILSYLPGTRGFIGSGRFNTGQLAQYSGWPTGMMPTPAQWASYMSEVSGYPAPSSGSEIITAEAKTPITGGGTTYPVGTPLAKIVVNSSSKTIGAMPDPSLVPTPNVINFTSATVDVSLESLPGASNVINCPGILKYEFPASFPAPWAGSHTLTADINEPDWVEEVGTAPFVRAMLSPDDWTLTLFEEDCTILGRREPRRAVARYRLPCKQCKRFDCNSTNAMELISCDRSVADWPFYLDVGP